jgi:hypothetical protein
MTEETKSIKRSELENIVRTYYQEKQSFNSKNLTVYMSYGNAYMEYVQVNKLPLRKESIDKFYAEAKTKSVAYRTVANVVNQMAQLRDIEFIKSYPDAVRLAFDLFFAYFQDKVYDNISKDGKTKASMEASTNQSYKESVVMYRNFIYEKESTQITYADLFEFKQSLKLSDISDIWAYVRTRGLIEFFDFLDNRWAYEKVLQMAINRVELENIRNYLEYE